VATMELSQKARDEFKEIWMEEYGIEMGDDEANLRGTNLLEIFRLILKPTDGTND